MCSSAFSLNKQSYFSVSFLKRKFPKSSLWKILFTYYSKSLTYFFQYLYIRSNTDFKNKFFFNVWRLKKSSHQFGWIYKTDSFASALNPFYNLFNKHLFAKFFKTFMNLRLVCFSLIDLAAAKINKNQALVLVIQCCQKM